MGNGTTATLPLASTTLAMAALGRFGLVGVGVALLLPSDPIHSDAALGVEQSSRPDA